jgi:SsrA-binding protein
MKQKAVPGQKIICLNRKASFNYFFIELIEAGISLKGSEVKSLRDGKGSIADSYAVDNNGELFLINSHIPLYRQSSYNNHDPKGERKLLLNRREINKLIGRINQEGLTLIPTKLYFVKGKVKVQIAVAKGKKITTKDKLKKQEIGTGKKQDY